VIYLADAIEPARDYPSVGIVRNIAETSLDKACLEILERSEEYLGKKGRTMDQDSIEALNWLRKEVNG
jgi:HD superfamily phosphohydrolase YqeK